MEATLPFLTVAVTASCINHCRFFYVLCANIFLTFILRFILTSDNFKLIADIGWSSYGIRLKGIPFSVLYGLRSTQCRIRNSCQQVKSDARLSVIYLAVLICNIMVAGKGTSA